MLIFCSTNPSRFQRVSKFGKFQKNSNPSSDQFLITFANCSCYFLNCESEVWQYTLGMILFTSTSAIQAISTGLKDTLLGNILNHCTVCFKLLNRKIHRLEKLPSLNPGRDIEKNSFFWWKQFVNIVDFHNNCFEYDCNHHRPGWECNLTESLPDAFN